MSIVGVCGATPSPWVVVGTPLSEGFPVVLGFYRKDSVSNFGSLDPNPRSYGLRKTGSLRGDGEVGKTSGQINNIYIKNVRGRGEERGV